MRIKNRLLLLSLIGTLGTNITSCSSEDTIASFGVSFEKNNESDNSDLENSIEETTLEEKIVDTETEVMDLINSGCIERIYYTTENISITIPSYLSINDIEENVILPKLECLEVYDQVGDVCLVKTNEYIGYVNTKYLEELLGTFVVIDISNQELKLYSDNEIILTTPVVTGKPKTPSDQGLFEIYNISGPRYLIGPDYKTYVDIMMKYNGGEGLHDAEYHHHEDGFEHGWRNQSEFGGETYLTDGSHGCINMLHEDVMTVSEYVEIGTKVLVKQ